MSMEDNPLPDEIKRNLLALSLFVDRRTFETLAYPAPEKLDVLISINLNVSAGLRGEGG
jgi:flagellar protein FlaF